MSAADPELPLPPLRPLRAEAARQDGREGIALSDPLGIARPCFVPRPLIPVLARLDGVHTPRAIAAAASRELRQHLDVEVVRRLCRDLDGLLLLQSPRFTAARDRELQQWLGPGARPPQHHGSAGYPEDPATLRRELSAMIPDPADATALPRGLIAPHIDLQRGRQGYAAAYSHLLGAPAADLFVVFGTGHQGPQAPVTGSPLDWQTPLGTSPTDREFVAAVHDAIGNAEPDDLLHHRAEHSLEFQVLMLQHLAERRGTPPPRVAGFLCGALPSTSGDPTAEPWFARLCAAFRLAERRHGGRVCYVAGADLAHVGPLFGDSESVDPPRLQQLERDERARLAHLERAEPGAFHRAVQHDDNPDRVCSATAITLTASLAGGGARLLHYGQAVDDDGGQAVTFCAASFPG